MSTDNKLKDVLNDLIKINNDRTKGYVNAAEQAKTIDVDLQAIFNKMADQSRKFAAALTYEVGRLGGEAATGTSASGWMLR
jgi:uncharacterized protein (TIGR02284 family)